MTDGVHVHCPTCGEPVAWVPDNRYRPFCSRRCQRVDLGAWLNEERRIQGDDALPVENLSATELEDLLDATRDKIDALASEAAKGDS